MNKIKTIIISFLIITESFCTPTFSGYIASNNKDNMLPKINTTIVLEKNINIFLNINILKKAKIEFDKIKDKEICKNKTFEAFINNKDKVCNIVNFINNDETKEQYDFMTNKIERKIKILGFEKIENIPFIYIQIIENDDIIKYN